MSQGLPVIYSKGQGFDNQFPEGEAGYHVDASSPQDVAEAIRRVVEGYPESQKNVVGLAKNFNWKEITARYDQVYKQINGET